MYLHRKGAFEEKVWCFLIKVWTPPPIKIPYIYVTGGMKKYIFDHSLSELVQLMTGTC